LLLGLFWFWATELIGGDDNSNTPTAVPGVAGGLTPTATGSASLLSTEAPTANPNVAPTQTADTGVKPTRTPRSSDEESPTASETVSFSEGDSVVTTESVNLRSEAALGENVITTLDAGVTLTVSGPTESVDGTDWVPVVTDNAEEGYVSAEFLEPAT
jgi:hypothetical protein